jgi:hypothetical protein
MKRKVLVLLAVVVCAAGTSQVRAQFNFRPIKRPNIANIFHPVVGAGTLYEETDKDGAKSIMELSVVGNEMVGAQQGYWVEFWHNDKRGGKDLTYAKALITPEDFVAHKAIFIMPGSSQPMEIEQPGTGTTVGDREKHRQVAHRGNRIDHRACRHLFLRTLDEG